MTTFYIRDWNGDVHPVKAGSPESAAEKFISCLEELPTQEKFLVEVAESAEGVFVPYTVYQELVQTFSAYRVMD